MTEPLSTEAYIKQAIPFLEEAWEACFHGQKEKLLSAEERGMGVLLSHFRLIAEGDHPLPPGVITTREAGKNTENAIRYWTEKLGPANEPVEWLQRWIRVGETTADALKRADEAYTALEVKLAQAEREFERLREGCGLDGCLMPKLAALAEESET